MKKRISRTTRRGSKKRKSGTARRKPCMESFPGDGLGMAFEEGDRRLDTSCSRTSFKNKLNQAQHR